MEFNIYTLGAGFYLEKIFNAIRFIVQDQGNFYTVMKLSAFCALIMLSFQAAFTSNFKETAKWMLGVVIFISCFLTTKATVHIHDRLPTAYGTISAPRTVQNVPWGLAVIGEVTSSVGKIIAEKFDMAFAATFVSGTYSKTGLLFGSKIVEDVGKLRSSDASAKQHLLRFYKQCVVPDLNIGYARKNGYNIKDLTDTNNIAEFLKNRSSNARLIYFSGEVKTYKQDGLLSQTSISSKQINEYVTCNKAAGFISDMLDYEMNERKGTLAAAFFSTFLPEKSYMEKDAIFESVLRDSYSIFVKSSRDAKDILIQNIMINSIKDSSSSVLSSYNKVATEEMAKASFHSVSQVAQKFVPILRAVLECLFYGVSPVIIILMLTPIGLDVLKNYAFSFIYLQLWLPMYSILFCIAQSWGKFSSAGITDVTYKTHAQISAINGEISMVAGYMLALIPVLSIFLTRGLVSSIGNLSSSIFYIPQAAAVQTAEQSVRGNFNIGNTQIDTHSYNTLSAGKHDDNYHWSSGMQKFVSSQGIGITQSPAGKQILDLSPAVHKTAGLAEVSMGKVLSSTLNTAHSEIIQDIEKYNVERAESTSAGLSKLLGYDKNYNSSNMLNKSWQENLSTSERQAFEETTSEIKKIGKRYGLSEEESMKFAVNASLGAGVAGSSVGVSYEGALSQNRVKAYEELRDFTRQNNFSKQVDNVISKTQSSSFSEQTTQGENATDSIKQDFAKSLKATQNHNKSIENLKSIQQTKSYYDSHSDTVNQSLTNNFMEWAIDRYGAEKTSSILLNDPQGTYQMMNEYIKAQGISHVEKLSKPNIDFETRQKELSQQYAVNSSDAESFVDKTLQQESGQGAQFNKVATDLKKGDDLKSKVETANDQAKTEVQNKVGGSLKDTSDILSNEKNNLKKKFKANEKRTSWEVRPEEKLKEKAIELTIGTKNKED